MLSHVRALLIYKKKYIYIYIYILILITINLSSLVCEFLNS